MFLRSFFVECVTERELLKLIGKFELLIGKPCSLLNNSGLLALMYSLISVSESWSLSWSGPI